MAPGRLKGRSQREGNISIPRFGAGAKQSEVHVRHRRPPLLRATAPRTRRALSITGLSPAGLPHQPILWNFVSAASQVGNIPQTRQRPNIR
jgi:hypothetical protein